MHRWRVESLEGPVWERYVRQSDCWSECPRFFKRRLFKDICFDHFTFHFIDKSYVDIIETEIVEIKFLVDLLFICIESISSHVGWTQWAYSFLWILKRFRSWIGFLGKDCEWPSDSNSADILKFADIKSKWFSNFSQSVNRLCDRLSREEWK